ncbi:hypothetical protein PLEOSDRAFT_1100367 [Pleurotus ostreatus PC15]|uniref:Oxidase ustYa n=1 Tax=Pleurotus ostreatus (strain PC15) TaxID=1137138 RepID=A0A067NY10_PLEO1|nr:hypothetical protein PLEOSDRAFT_1100367 [Pleurotus ostreatus PC15]
MKRATSTVWVVLLLALLNIILVLRRLFHPWKGAQQEAAYSYMGMNYPLIYPIRELDPVAMTLQETVRFGFNASDPIEGQEWDMINAIPRGIGRTRLGPDHRAFVLTFLHQMHCVRRIQYALLNRNDTMASAGHVSHCLNYLRQTILCEAADSVEKGDFMEIDYEEERVGETLVCRDWETAISIFDERYEDWVKWRNTWN